MLASTLLISSGAFIKILPDLLGLPVDADGASGMPWTDIMIHTGHILNAIAGPMCMAGIVQLSESWFGPYERTTSTGIGTQACLLGVAVNFIVAPLVVKGPVAGEIHRFLWVQFLLSVPPLLGVLVYFPSHPPSPPSKSSTTKSESVAETLKQLMCHRGFLLVAACYGASTGVYMGWSILLEDSLHALGYGQDEAGLMGFLATVVGAVGGVALGHFADRFHRFKFLLITLYVVSAGFWTYFALACMKIVPHSLWILYTVASLGSLSVNASIPLYYELSVEQTYPLSEGTVGNMLANSNNFFCMIFLFAPLNKVGVGWINWAIVGTCVAFGVLLLFLKEKYNRYDYDTTDDKEGKQLKDAASTA